MVKPQLFVVGCLFGLAGTLGDMFFRAPDYVIWPLLITGIVLMLMGVRATRRSKRAVPPPPMASRWRRFALYLVLAAAALVVSFFGLQRSHPDFSVELVVGICASTFVFCAGIFYWQLFIRAK